MPFRVSVPRMTCWLFLCLIYYFISRRLFSINIDPGISDTYKNVAENISNFRAVNVDEMSGRQMLEYLQWNPSSDCRYDDINIRFQSSLPICLDPRIRPEAGSCLAYFFRLNLKHRIMEKGEEFNLIRALARYIYFCIVVHKFIKQFYYWHLSQPSKMETNTIIPYNMCHIYNFVINTSHTLGYI